MKSIWIQSFCVNVYYNVYTECIYRNTDKIVEYFKRILRINNKKCLLVYTHFHIFSLYIKYKNLTFIYLYIYFDNL